MSSASSSMGVRAAHPVEVSLLYLYLLRAGYALLVFGLGSSVWPRFFHHAQWTFWHGVGESFLAAIALLAIVGLRYPLKMLPLLFFEIAWKAIWILAVPLPLWIAHAPIDADTASTLQECTLAIIFVLVIPWRYVFTTFVLQPGERWR